MPGVDLSILIVNWNAYELAAECVDSILRTVQRVKCEIIIVDNSQSSSGRDAWRRKLNGEVRVIFNPNNVGFAAASNQAMQSARGEYFVLLNPDSIVMPGSMDGMVELLSREEKIGILGCQLVNSDGTRQTSAYTIYPSLVGALLDSAGLLFAWRTLRNRFNRGTLPGTYEPVSWIKGACLMTRRKVVAQIGPMDEGFFLYSEDADWCKRARDGGWTIAMARQWTVLHRGRGSAVHAPEASIRAYYDSYFRFVIKHQGQGLLGLRAECTRILLRFAALTRLIGVTAARPSPSRSRVARAYWRYVTSRRKWDFEGTRER